MTHSVSHSGDFRAPCQKLMTNASKLTTYLLFASAIATTATAQIPISEFAARRDSLAARLDSGVVVAYGGRALVHGNGGYLTHEHALVLARDAHPRGYVGDPEPRDTAGPAPVGVAEVAGEEVVVETATVEHGRDGTPVQAFLVARTAAGARYAASTAPGDVASAAALSLDRGEVVGRRVRAISKDGHVEVS